METVNILGLGPSSSSVLTKEPIPDMLAISLSQLLADLQNVSSIFIFFWKIFADQ